MQENVSRISAQKRQDGSDGVQIGGRVHCGGERPGIWGALLPSPTSHHLPSSSPVHSALPDFVQLATSRAARFSRRPLCSALGCAKFASAEQEELPLSRAETNSPPPPALTTVQSSAEQGGTEQSRAPTTVQESSTLLRNLPPLQSGLCRIKPGSRGLQSPSIQILLLPEKQHARGKCARQQ